MVLPDIVVQLTGWDCSKDKASADWVFFVHQKKQVGGGYPADILKTEKEKKTKLCEIIDPLSQLRCRTPHIFEKHTHIYSLAV